MKNKLLKAIVSVFMIIVMIAGMSQGMRQEAKAGSIPGTYEIRFVANGSNVSNLPKTLVVGAGSLCSIPSQKPTRTNYAFVGWATSPSATTANANYAPGKGNIRLSGDLTLYAVWKCTISTYTISFSTNGVSGVKNLPSNFTVGAGSKYSIPKNVPTRSGYTFLGYDTSSSAKTVVRRPGDGNIACTGNVTLYPVWKCTPTITIKTMSGTTVGQYTLDGPKTLTVSDLNSILKNTFKKADPKAGYSRHWYNSSKKEFKSSIYISGNTTLYYDEFANRQKTVFVGPDGNEIKTVVLKTGDKLSDKISEPSVAYKVFLGWGLMSNPAPVDGLYQQGAVCFFDKDDPDTKVYYYACCWNSDCYVVYKMRKSEVIALHDDMYNIKLTIDDKCKITDGLKGLAQSVLGGGEKGTAIGRLFAKSIKGKIVLTVTGWALKSLSSSEFLEKTKDSAWYKNIVSDCTDLTTLYKSMTDTTITNLKFKMSYDSREASMYPTRNEGCATFDPVFEK